MKYSIALALLPLICLVGTSSAFNFHSSANNTSERDGKCKNVILFKTNSQVKEMSMTKCFENCRKEKEKHF